MATSQIRLLCLQRTPSQFDPPLWRALASRGKVRPTVWYTHPGDQIDQELKRKIDWGLETPGESNYHLEYLSSLEVARRLLFSPLPWDVILAPGWVLALSWLAGIRAHVSGKSILLPSDKISKEPSDLIRFDRFISVFHALKGQFFDGHFVTGSLATAEAQRVGIRSEQIAPGYYSIDCAYWTGRSQATAPQARELRSSLNSKNVVIAVAKMAERENPLALIDCMKSLRARVPDAHLLFVGDGPLRGAVEQRISDLGLTQAVTLLGYVPYPDLAGCYAAADVFVHIPIFEPWGISIAEAMTCGLPCVTTPNVGAAHDLIVPGSTGCFAKSHDPEHVAEALASALLLRRDETRGKAQESAQTLDVHVIAAGLERLIHHLQSTHQGPYARIRHLGRAISTAWSAPTASFRAPL